uniref:Uncharacterized protein n=1 Tax=Rhizophagus irregularis (strain DAOM 181602 / DAOM 197198 / MUCL 43194) TaxID=747089 RepID=U9SV89_RHIID
MKDEVESQYKQYQKINHICYTMCRQRSNVMPIGRIFTEEIFLIQTLGGFVPSCVAFHRSLHTGESIDQSHNRIDQQVWIRKVLTKRISRLERGMTSIQEQMSSGFGQIIRIILTILSNFVFFGSVLQINYTITCHPNNNLTVLTTSIFHVTNRDISDSAQTIEDAVL